MGDVDDLQQAEEAAAQRAEDAKRTKAERQREVLREEPLRPQLAVRARQSRDLPLTQVHPGDNIRLDLPEIQELARSIREMGLLTPLLVRPWNHDADADGTLPKEAKSGVDQYRLVAGHRRYAALTALVDAGLHDFADASCEVREGLSEAEVYALMLTENVQRVALEPIQAARALRLLLDLNEGMDAATLARSLGLKTAWAQTHLKLLDLPQEVQDRVEAGDLSVTIADLLRRGESAGRIDKETMVDLAARVASGEITSTQARKEAGPPPKPNTQAPKTVSAGPDGKPFDPDGPGSWANLGDLPGADGNAIARPATPLTGASPGAPGAGTSTPRTPAAAAAGARDGVPMPAVIPYEDRLDAYLLGRALREWATDDYLDELGIDRVQAETYATLLGFEERIAAIRHLSATLMDSSTMLVGAR